MRFKRKSPHGEKPNPRVNTPRRGARGEFSACSTGKVVYETMELAAESAKAWRAKGKELRPYPCQFCGTFHLTGQPYRGSHIEAQRLINQLDSKQFLYPRVRKGEKLGCLLTLKPTHYLGQTRWVCICTLCGEQTVAREIEIGKMRDCPPAKCSNCQGKE